MARTHLTTTISDEDKKAAKDMGLSYAEALSFGITFRAAERDACDYPSNLLTARIETMAERLAEAMRHIEELESAPAAREKIDDEDRTLKKRENNFPGDYYGN